DRRGARRIVGGRGRDEAPAWSPDGRRIAFEKAFYKAGAREDALKTIDVWTAGADGRGRRKVTRDRDASSPAWSPHGGTLAFAGTSGGVSGIFVISSAGGRPRLLSRHDEAALWSPDGRWIALVRSGTAREAGIFLMASDGRARKRVTRGLDSEPAWSPDGR